MFQIKGGIDLKKVLSKIRAVFSRLGITSQMAIYCFLLFALTFFLSSVFNQEIYKNLSLDQANRTVSQTLYLIDENINNVINAINETSKSIISNSEVRAYMNSADPRDGVSAQSEVRNFIRNILDNVSYATSVHLFKNTGGVMNISIRMINYPISENIENAPWYEDVRGQQGDYSLIYNGGGFFHRTSKHDFISMVRLFNDIETQECTGVQITNFSTDTLKTAFKNLVDEYGMQVVIFDGAGQEIVSSDMSLDTRTVLETIKSSDGYVIKDINGSEYMISTRENSYGLEHCCADAHEGHYERTKQVFIHHADFHTCKRPAHVLRCVVFFKAGHPSHKSACVHHGAGKKRPAGKGGRSPGQQGDNAAYGRIQCDGKRNK